MEPILRNPFIRVADKRPAGVPIRDFPLAVGLFKSEDMSPHTRLPYVDLRFVIGAFEYAVSVAAGAVAAVPLCDEVELVVTDRRAYSADHSGDERCDVDCDNNYNKNDDELFM